MESRASSLAKVGFTTTAATSVLIAAVLFTKGNVEWVFFTSLATAAGIQVVLCFAKQFRGYGIFRTVADVGSLSLIAVTAVWLWIKVGSSLMLVNAVAVLAIMIIYLITVFSGRGNSELMLE